MNAIFFSSLDNPSEFPPQGTPQVPEQFVRQMGENPSDLSDTDLNAFICACAERFVAAHRRYEVSGDFADAGDRDRWWLKEAEALVERGNRKGAH